MRVVIAGGHGKIALILERLLSERGDTAVGLIRNPDHVADVEATGAQAVVVDLEAVTAADVATHLQGADAVVFAAGAGPGSGAARKQTVDCDAAILLADAAEIAGVRRYVMVSAIGADVEAPDDIGDPVFVAYLRAKGHADDVIRARDALEVTVIRPGHLTNDAGTGRVEISDQTGHGDIPREDVAKVLLGMLDTPETAGRTFELIGGETPIAQAVNQAR
ncbi:NAD(P)-binding oxidoreductase [Mycobacterium sp. 29Ha]|uniref:NAD(P)-binding oxidoreductase n=1 Tax=Mycobacterium sp. 29Ha TaxID=2939268 RepID=UPI0029390DA3|nr:NAD(P)-binding oxidoreductase [Mycobacterium sp. 29Ha]MDV3134145.1 SDR family oxidoreductase [Mycobacterium sp. 29Ha]